MALCPHSCRTVMDWGWKVAPFGQFSPALLLFTWVFVLFFFLVSCLVLEFGISSLAWSHFIGRGCEVGGRGGPLPKAPGWTGGAETRTLAVLNPGHWTYREVGNTEWGLGLKGKFCLGEVCWGRKVKQRPTALAAVSTKFSPPHLLANTASWLYKLNSSWLCWHKAFRCPSSWLFSGAHKHLHNHRGPWGGVQSRGFS